MGTASSACTWTFCPPLRPDTEHVELPAGWQIVKVGATSLGEAPSVSLALPPLPPVSQTQIANCTLSWTFTVLLLPRV